MSPFCLMLLPIHNSFTTRIRKTNCFFIFFSKSSSLGRKKSHPHFSFTHANLMKCLNSIYYFLRINTQSQKYTNLCGINSRVTER